MKKSIFLSGMVIVLVLAFTAVATFAYFSGTTEETAKITTASINIGGTAGFPLNFLNMLPGEEMSLDFRVRNTGNRPADFYFQLVGENSDSGNANYMNYCQEGSLGFDTFYLTVRELDGPGGSPVKKWVDEEKVCNLYPGHPESIIAKIGINVDALEYKYYRTTVKFNELAGNEYQAKSNWDIVNLIALQQGAPPPEPDPTSPYSAWPLTGVGP
jgi:hypothetical protein